LLKAKPCDVNVLVVVASAQTGYASYIANLPYFMKATCTGQKILINAKCVPLSAPTDMTMLPWNLPSVIYDFKVKPTDRAIEALKEHSEPVFEGRSKQFTFVLKEPTQPILRQLDRMNPKPSDKTRHILGAVNLSALKVAKMLISLTTVIVATHNYPAFRTASDTELEEHVVLPDTPRRKKRKAEDSILSCVLDHENRTDELSPEELAALASNSRAVPHVTLTAAKPSNRALENWGDAAHIPNADGLFAPYVAELAVGDSKTILGVITHYFAKSLGGNLATVLNQIQILKTGLGVIGDTVMGKEMTHFYKCLEIALRGQASVYPIFTSGKYEGTVIWGSGYKVAIGTTVYEPVAYAELQKIVSDSSMHSKALQDIEKLLDGRMEDVDTITSIRSLANIARDAELSTDTRNEIIKLSHNLCFDTKYWSMTAYYVTRALELIASGNEPGDDVPMHPTVMFTSDRVESILSAFGYTAPSFLIPNGQRIRLGEGTEAPKNLHARPVALQMAVSDMKYVMGESMITNNNSNLSSRHKDVPYKAKSKAMVWDALVEVGKMADSKPAAVVAGMSGAGDGNEGQSGLFEMEW